MQVEVSKHTEGLKENVVRPNGLSSSLIRYDGAFNSNSPLKLSLESLLDNFLIQPMKLVLFLDLSETYFDPIHLRFELNWIKINNMYFAQVFLLISKSSQVINIFLEKVNEDLQLHNV